MSGHAYLKAERLKQGLSLRALGEKAGVSHVQVMSLEKGAFVPGIDTLLKLLTALNIPTAVYLKVIGYEEPKKKGKVAVQGFEPRTLRI